MNPDQLGPLFVHPGDPDWLWVVAAAVALPSLPVAVLGIVRGRLSPATALAGLVLLPGFGYLLGNLVLMEQAKGIEFCASCHETMGPIVEALAQENSSLASTHYRNGYVIQADACYTCHSGYGVWGTMDAKVAGVIHMVRSVVGAYEYPLQASGTFDIEACLHCHAENVRFRSVGSHRDQAIQTSLLSREMSCTTCHPPAHPAVALNGADAWQRESR